MNAERLCSLPPSHRGRCEPREGVPRPGIPSIGPHVWIVSVSDGPIHVQPIRHLISVGQWGRFRDEWPKNEKQLRRGIARCEAWCERQNAKEIADRALVRAVTEGQEDQQ